MTSFWDLSLHSTYRQAHHNQILFLRSPPPPLFFLFLQFFNIIWVSKLDTVLNATLTLRYSVPGSLIKQATSTRVGFCPVINRVLMFDGLMRQVGFCPELKPGLLDTAAVPTDTEACGKKNCTCCRLCFMTIVYPVSLGLSIPRFLWHQ